MTVRMNDALRQRLGTLVDQTIGLPELDVKLQQAYAAAEPLVRGAVEVKYPVKDMRVCAKYEAAGPDDCIKLSLAAGGVQQFDFAKGTGPLVAKKTYQGQVYLADQATTNAVLNWITARDEQMRRTKMVRADYHALIRGARTLEEIIEIWPAADTVSEFARSRALTVLSEDVVARIRADVARRTDDTKKARKRR
jgi:hypothetical protein